jgi:hypothetical protein
MPTVKVPAKECEVSSSFTQDDISVITVQSTTTQGTRDISDDDLLSIRQLFDVFASGVKEWHSIDCTPDSIVTSHEPRSLAVSYRSIATEGPNPSSTSSQARGGRLFDKMKVDVHGYPFLALCVLERIMAELRVALNCENPRDGVCGLLNTYGRRGKESVDIEGSPLELHSGKWQSIIEEFCDSPEEAREVLDDPDFQSTLPMVVEQRLQHTLEARQSGKEGETDSLQERDAFGPLKPEERPTWNALAIVSNSLLGFLILSLVVLCVTLHLKRRRFRQAERERDRRYGEEERLERILPSQEGTELRPMHSRGSAL